MSEHTDLLDFARSLGLLPIGELVSDPTIDDSYFLTLKVVYKADGRKDPSKTQLLSAKKQFEEKGYLINFVLDDGGLHHIEEGLRSSILVAHSKYIRNVFVSRVSNDVEVWLDRKIELPDTVLSEIHRHIETYMNLCKIRKIKISDLSNANTPTKTEIAQIIRQSSPVLFAEIKQFIFDRNLNIPSDDWLARSLDLMRKVGTLVRQRDGTYVLTLKALRVLGSRKGRGSPDVRRLLALARGVR